MRITLVHAASPVVAAGVVLALVASTAPAQAAMPGATGVLAWSHTEGASAGSDGSYDLWVSGPSGLAPLVTDPGNDLDAAFSPVDPELVAYAGRGPDGADREIRLVRLDGSARTVLVRRAGNDRAPSWSPDGSRLVFSGAVGEDLGTYDIYLVGADGSGLTRLVGGDGNQLWPSFSPAGDRILYEAPVKGKKPGSTTTALFVRTLADGSTRQLTEAAAGAVNPNWSPDGEHVVFEAARQRGNGTEIYTMPAAGGEARRVGAYGAFPDFTPDGRRVVFQMHNDGTGSRDIASVESGLVGTTAGSGFRWEVELQGHDAIPRYQAKRDASPPPAPAPCLLICP